MKRSRRSFSCSTTAAGARSTKLAFASFASALRISPRGARFLAQALALGGDVDLDLQHELEIAGDRDRCVGRRQLGIDDHLAQARERREVRRERLHRAASPCTSSGSFCAGEMFISLRSVRHAVDDLLQRGDLALGRLVDAFAAAAADSGCSMIDVARPCPRAARPSATAPR